MKRKTKVGFTPISIEKYVELHLKSNKDTTREEITKGLNAALTDYEKGVTCSNCGNPIWVIGSAMVGNACFTCITGEAEPDNDYEIDEAMK